MSKQDRMKKLSDDELEMVSGGAVAAPSEWAGYRVSHNPRRCPHCSRQTDGCVLTGACESEGVRAMLYW